MSELALCLPVWERSFNSLQLQREVIMSVCTMFCQYKTMQFNSTICAHVWIIIISNVGMCRHIKLQV